MRQEWDPEELVEAWTLMGADWRRIGNKRGATRLGFAVLLKFFELEARFPLGAQEVPSAVVAYLAEQVRVPVTDFATYGWVGRTIEYHRAQVREAFGFREAARRDESNLTVWLGQEVALTETSDQALMEAPADDPHQDPRISHKSRKKVETNIRRTAPTPHSTPAQARVRSSVSSVDRKYPFGLIYALSPWQQNHQC